jgi:DNA (cytosine-5)-methyltransferase 1
VHAHRFPHIPNLGDVTAPDFIEMALAHAPVDVVVFGSPCQSFSVAGNRHGLDDERGNLAIVAIDVVARLRPRWFLFENVPGLLSNWSGIEDRPDAVPGDEWEGREDSDFAALLGAVRERGYLGCWRSFDAQYAGLAQRRERVFFVGHLGDWRPAAAVLFERESLRGDPPPCREAGQGVANAVRASASPNGHGNSHGLRGDGADNLISFNKPIIPMSAHGASGRNGAGIGRVGDPMMSLQAGERHAIAFAENSRAELRLEGGDGQTVASLKTGGGKPGQSYPAIAFADLADPVAANQGRTYTREGSNNFRLSNVAIASMAVRRLTPRECERLQGLPDDWTLIDYRGKPAADGPRYRAIGNGMAVPVVRWILERIWQYEAQSSTQPETEIA